MTIRENILNKLRDIVGPKHVLSTPEDLICYSYDGTFAEHKPDVVVSPVSTEQVSSVLQVAHQEHIAVIPRGMASGLAAATVPLGGELMLNLTRMNNILEIDEENMTATAQAGVITADLAAAVEAKGLFYPPDPASIRQSTLGGNVACNSGGPRCLKYGVTGDYVMALEAVLADGRVLRTGNKCLKDVTGYDLVHLLVGSEGTLAVITEITVRLIPKPQTKRTALAIFEHIEAASKAVNAILRAGVLPATLEIIDETAVRCVEDYLHLGLDCSAEAMLIVETDGDPQSAAREIEVVAEVCRQGGAREVTIARDAAESDVLWRARRSVSPSLGRVRPNKLGEDIVVPRAAIPDMVIEIKKISVKHDLPIVIFGHAGDGNLHPNILFDRRDEDEWKRVEAAVSDLFAAAVKLGGTLSGEHGVGTLKKPYLEMALGPLAIEVMSSVKRALDPDNILNPGKVLPVR
ncbi:MAG: FAD-binding protein [Anaerolineae bacterium]|nr:FAD-binding protein [Anaerolineae bacterium]